MENYIKYIVTIIYIIIAEFIWIYLLNAKNYAYVTKLVQKTEMKINIYYAIIAYIIVFLSIFVLAIPYSNIYINKKDKKIKIILKSLYYSGIVGFFIYSIYNFTSISIYENYTLNIAIKDTLWGTFLYATACTIFNYLNI
tara:strand:+ start:47 stop:466 length:420 start_codon:yes stop_codon:yes gene_type:complete